IFTSSAIIPAMITLPEILAFNAEFVASRAYESYLTGRLPDKKIVIVTCMDTRLTELLPKAMNLKKGDAKFIKVAGAIVAAPPADGVHASVHMIKTHPLLPQHIKVHGLLIDPDTGKLDVLPDSP